MSLTETLFSVRSAPFAAGRMAVRRTRQQGHIRAAVLVYGVLGLGVMLMPREIGFWLDNFAPNRVTEAAGTGLAALAAGDAAVGLAAVHDTLQDGFRQLAGISF